LTDAIELHILMQVNRKNMVNAKIKHDCKTELNDVDLRATPARLALLKLLEVTDKPVDVQSMIEYLDKKDIETDPATVFRIVNMFTEKGLTKQIQLQEGKFRYELASKEDHHHLVCTRCGEIQDMSDCNIDVLESHIEKKKNFKVTSHALEFYGICRKCLDKQKEGN
jgi:Fur family transcriptional regulator, ferric uptake regulator